MKLKYTGPGHSRSFVKADFTRHGLEGDDVKAVHFDADNNFVAEVSDAVGQWLIANEAPEFREATEDDEKEQDLTRVGTPARPMGKLPDSIADDVDASESASETPATPAGGRGRRS